MVRIIMGILGKKDQLLLEVLKKKGKWALT
jgi:hypothetical protein